MTRKSIFTTLLSETRPFLNIFMACMLSLQTVKAQCPGDCGTVITPASNLNLNLTINSSKVCFDASAGDIVYTGAINLQAGGHITICGGTSNTVYLNGTFTEGGSGAIRYITVDGNLEMTDADGVSNYTKTAITVNGSMEVHGGINPTGFTGTSSLTINTGAVVTVNAVTTSIGSTFSIDGTLNVNGNITTSASTNFTNTGAVNITGHAPFSGIYNNHGVWNIGGKLSLSAGSGSDLTNGRFYCFDLELNSATITASAPGCAAFIVTNFSDVNSAGLIASGAIGIWDLGQPGFIDDVNNTCSSGAPGPWSGGPYCGVIPITSLDDAGGCFATLPVTWYDYSALRTSETIVKVEWATAKEENNAYFTVQKSSNGLSFTDIGTVKGNNNSLTLNHYGFTDYAASPADAYYRVKQTDYDGNYAYSSIMKVKGINSGKLNVDLYPNPIGSDQEINLSIAGLETNNAITVSLMNNIGHTLYHQSFATESTTLHLAIGQDLTLQKGLYFITINNGSNNLTQKLLVE